MENEFNEKINVDNILCYRNYKSGILCRICKIDGFSKKQENFLKNENSFLYKIIVPKILNNKLNKFEFYKKYLEKKLNIILVEENNLYYINLKEKSPLDEKIEKLADILKDYRARELLNPKKENITLWINQFSDENREIILDEMINIFNKLYLTEEEVQTFLTGLLTNKKLAGANYQNYWNEVSLLDIQTDGSSQKIMVEKFKDIIHNEMKINVSINDNEKKKFIYIDDFLFTGGRLRNDLNEWFKNAPQNARLDIIYVGYFKSGQYYTESTWLKDNNNKKLDIHFWRLLALENKTNCQDNSHILFPIHDIIDQEESIKNYLSIQNGYKLREVDQGNGYKCEKTIFSSEINRQILEKEFTLAGLKINEKFNDEKKRKYWKPLGISPFNGLGFGALVFTYRNCPNNTPLCLWWGDWDNNQIWYPLLQRKTYS